LLDLLLVDVPKFFQKTIVLTTKSLVPIPVPVSRANAYSGGVFARALPEGLRYDTVHLSLAELRHNYHYYDVNRTCVDHLGRRCMIWML
jgi:hypothetical protein